MAYPTEANNPPPSFNNNFYIKLTQTPHPASTTPYIPKPIQEIYDRCSANLQETQGVLSPMEEFIFRTDEVIILLSGLDLQSLLNCSGVNRNLYLTTTQIQTVWVFQLSSFLSNVKPEKNCLSPPYHQFQIIYKEIRNRLQPFILEFKHNETIGSFWTGPNSPFKELHIQFEAAGGIDAYNRMKEMMKNNELISDEILGDDPEIEQLDQTIERYDQIGTTKDFKAWQLYHKLFVLKQQLYELTGQDYEGDFDPIILPEEGTKQTQLLRVINFLGLEEYNDQAKFKEVILRSEEEARKKSSSANSSVVVEEVMDSETQPQN